MNVLWTKEKYHKIFNTENVNLHASGDGAVAGHSCRLCGGDTNLRAFADSYLWEGVEERYDQLLYDCFGVRVSPADCLICEWCVRQLRNTERFRALVNAAFEKTSSSSISTQHEITRKQKSENNTTTANKDIINLLKNKMATDVKNKKQPVERKIDVNPNNDSKRENLICTVCKQKYLMMVKSEIQKNFVCSRCNKFKGKKMVCKKCDDTIPAAKINEHLISHNGINLLEENRPNNLSKKPSQMKRKEVNAKTSKYKCPVCPKKYSTPQFLTDHITRFHGEEKPKPTCKKYLKTKEITNRIQKIPDESKSNFGGQSKVLMRRNHSLRCL